MTYYEDPPDDYFRSDYEDDDDDDNWDDGEWDIDDDHSIEDSFLDGLYEE